MPVPRLLLLILASLMFAPLALAQGSPQQPVVHYRDGGGGGPMESLFVPPKAGAPFSFTLVTDWSRFLEGGGALTLTNQRRIMRDSNGRIYQERWLLVPKGGKVKSFMDRFQITDPETHTWYNCETATKVCNLYPYHLLNQKNYQPAIGTSGPLPNGNGVRQVDDLGPGTAQGEDTHGYRETITINAGAMGNDRPMVSTREFWFCPRLGFNLISTVDDPQTGKQVFTVKDFSTSEPEPSFFQIPAGYKIVNRPDGSN